VAEATVSEASGVCDDAETRDGMEGCREAFHAAAGACDELGAAREDCREAVELSKDEAETLYEARKLEAEGAAGCEDIVSLDAELGATCEEIVEGVGEACAGDEFASCREAFHEAKAVCEGLGELAYQGCKGAAEALKDAAEAGDDDGTESIDPAIAELRAAFEAAQSCAELPDGALAAGCQSAIDELTEACSDLRADAQRDGCRDAFHELLDVFHEGRQACDVFGASSDACIEAIERVKDAAERDVKDSAEHNYEELKNDAEQARSCDDVAALDTDAGAACSAVAATVVEVCIGGGETCREAFHEARDACKALGALAAEGCMSEVDGIKNSAEKDEESAEKLSSAGEGEGNGEGRGRGSSERGGRGGSD